MARDPKDKYNPLRKSYPFSRKINSVSFEAETMFTRLIALCDDQAVYDASPHHLCAGLFRDRWEGGQVDVTKAARWRAELVTAGLIRVWKAEDGREYLQLTNPIILTRKDVNPEIRYPLSPYGLPEGVTLTARQRAEHGPTTAHRPDQTRPDDTTPDQEQQGVGFEESAEPAPPSGEVLPDLDHAAALMQFICEFRQFEPDIHNVGRLPGWNRRGEEHYRPNSWALWALGQPPELLASITAARLRAANRWGDEKKLTFGPGTYELWWGKQGRNGAAKPHEFAGEGARPDWEVLGYRDKDEMDTARQKGTP